MQRKRAKIIENGDPHIPQVSTQISLVKATSKLKYEAESVNRLPAGFVVPYTANGHNLHNIDAGDVLFDVVMKEGHAAYQKSSHGGTMARARLNNVQLPATFDYNVVNTQNTAETRKIWRMFRFYGFSVKQHLVNIHDPQSIDIDDPVAMVSGTMSVRNYTEETIEMGTPLFYHFPNPNSNQFIANNLSTQKEIRESKAFELRPLADELNLLSGADMYRHLTVARHYHNFFKFCLADRLYDALHRAGARPPIIPAGVPVPGDYRPNAIISVIGMNAAKFNQVQTEIANRLNAGPFLFEISTLQTAVNNLDAEYRLSSMKFALDFFRALYIAAANHPIQRNVNINVPGLAPTPANADGAAVFTPIAVTVAGSLSTIQRLRYLMYAFHIDTAESYTRFDAAIKAGLANKLLTANAAGLQDADEFPTDVLIHVIFTYLMFKEFNEHQIGDYNSIQVLRLPFDRQILQEMQWMTAQGFPTRKGMRCVEYMDILESNMSQVGIPTDVLETAVKLARWYVKKFPVDVDQLVADPRGLYLEFLQDTVSADLSRVVKENVNFIMSRFAGVAQQDAKAGQLFLFNATPNFRQMFQDVL